MDDYTSHISMSSLNSDYNGDMTTTTHDGLVTIKHEPQDIEEENFHIQTTQFLPFLNQEPVTIHNQQTINNYTKRFDLKECYICLEKCDKIWETLKVIKNLQTPKSSKSNKNQKTTTKNNIQNQLKIASPIPYQPVLNNGNSSLPNFQFAIKSWKRLYTCTYCGKQYVDNRSLKSHLLKLHNVTTEADLSQSKEIPSPIEIPRPLEITRKKEITRSKEFPRPMEIPKFQEFPRSTGKTVDPTKPLVCDTCGVRYSDARSLASHSLRVHGILTEFHERWLAQQENPNDYTVEDLLKRHSCNSCGKKYSCMKSLRLHYLREHNFVLPPQRAGRQKIFKQPSTTALIHTGDLQKHMNVCTICGKKYTKNWYLRVHCLEVHGIPMVCNRTKKNFKPTLRVIKKEVIDEPEINKNLPPTDINFPLTSVKQEVTETEIPAKNLLKMYQCTACKKEYISISKLRTHCFALHGIIIPRIRKSYKKSNNTNIPTEVKTDSKLKVSTPKQVSLDRYFKSPINGENVITNTTQKLTKRVKVSREVPSEMEKKVLKDLPKESPPSKTVIQPKAPVNLIRCNLCSCNCKDIRKHYIAYHKIRYPESNVMKDLATTSDNSSITLSSATEKQSDSIIKKQPPRKRRRKFITMGKKKKRKIDNTPIESIPMMMEVDEVENQKIVSKFDESQIIIKKESPKTIVPIKTQYKCNICGGYYATPKSLKIHRQLHRMKGETKNNIHLISHKYKNRCKTPNLLTQKNNETFNEDLDGSMGNDSRTSSNESITPSLSSASSTTDSVDRSVKSSSSSSSRKIYSASETTCECGRGFRDPHTMYLHKDKCPTVIKMERDKIIVARSSSDRDSGIGISITIKKKNDSYEIVSRDSGDDDKSKDSSISKDSDQMSHSSDSNFSSSVFNDRKFLDLIPGQCSKDHSVLKIEDADDDVDVDIEDDSQTNNSEGELMHTSISRKEAKSTKEIDEDDVINDNDNNRTIDPLDMDLYRCAICLELFKDMESLTKHMSLHESMRVVRQECPCGKTFRGAQSFLTHVEKYHPLWLQCGYCDVTFLSSKEYYSHSCDVNKNGKEFQDLQEIICHYCSTKVRMLNFESHVKAHHFIREKPFLCYFCKMRFSTKRQRTIHLTSDHAKPNCQICGQTLRFDFVAKHEAYHQGLGYPCHTCKKAFASFKLMKHHRFDVHTRDDVKCTICMKTMTRKHIKYHMESHSIKEKCKLCTSTFLNNTSFENHIKSEHNNVYPFLKCDTCNETFIVEKELKKHFAQNLCNKNVDKKIIKKPMVVMEIQKKSETLSLEPVKNSLNGIIKTEVPTNDGNHSEMEESVDMDEPLALEASSDMEGLLEAANSTMDDIREQNDGLESETISPSSKDEFSQAEKMEIVKEKEIVIECVEKSSNGTTMEEISNATEILQKIPNVTENLKAKEILETNETLEPKEQLSGTENLEPKETQIDTETLETETLAVTETLESRETENIGEKLHEEKVSEPSEIEKKLESQESSDLDESLNLIDSFGFEDTDTLQIDTSVSCNLTAKSEKEILITENSETRDISKSLENSDEKQFDA